MPDPTFLPGGPDIPGTGRDNSIAGLIGTLFRPFLVVELAQQCATRFRRTEGSRALVRPCRSPSPMPRANCRQGQ